MTFIEFRGLRLDGKSAALAPVRRGSAGVGRQHGVVLPPMSTIFPPPSSAAVGVRRQENNWTVAQQGECAFAVKIHHLDNFCLRCVSTSTFFPTNLMTNSLTKSPYKQMSHIFVLFVSQKLVANQIGLLQNH
jgi:hypothetical protein